MTVANLQVALQSLAIGFTRFGLQLRLDGGHVGFSCQKVFLGASSLRPEVVIAVGVCFAVSIGTSLSGQAPGAPTPRGFRLRYILPVALLIAAITVCATALEAISFSASAQRDFFPSHIGIVFDLLYQALEPIE
jgi:hypothetical protein